MSDKNFLQKAIAISITNIANGGGPFGAVVVQNGDVIAQAGNSVTKDCDPTAHAEINAIRLAAKALQTHDLSSCILYSSCEPCPMCLSAIYWSGIKTVFYANSKLDAENAGFDDAHIYKELALPDALKSIALTHVETEDGLEAFRIWKTQDTVTPY